jgi:parallel beta-helix repeat protein
MKSKFKYALVPVFLLLALATVGASSAYTTYDITENTYINHFNSSGYINDTNIQDGDVLDLSGDITNKNMYIDRPLNITSSDQTGKIINGRIEILGSGSWTNVTNLNISNTNSGTMGIFLYEAQHCTVQGNYIHTCGHYGYGIPMSYSNYNNIIGNTVITTQGGDGWTSTAIPLGDSHNNTIANNQVFSDGANCIYLSFWGGSDFVGGLCYNNTILNNTCAGVNTVICYAIQMMGSNNTAQNNTIAYLDIPGKASSYALGAYRGISSMNDGPDGNTIIGNTITAGNCDIYAYSNCLVTENVLYSSNSTQSAIYAGTNSTVTNNIINIGNGTLVGVYGIYIAGANCTISGNLINSTDTSKSSVYDSKNNGYNNITNNTINSAYTGIQLKTGGRDTISNNTIITTSTYAVDSHLGSYSTVTNNRLISDNTAKQGDTAVYKAATDTVSGNYGIAHFTATPTSGDAPLNVTFTDDTIYNPTIWSWLYSPTGAGTWTEFSTIQNPVYVFNTTGTYDIQLIAGNSTVNNTIVKTGYIIVDTPVTPVANFTANPTSGRASLTVQFTDTSTNNPTSWRWDFNNDGIIDSTQQNPLYKYMTAGVYTVTLNATNAAGSDNETKTDYITVTAPNPQTFAINETTYLTYFDSSGYIKDLNTIVDGDVLDIGPLNNKNMFIDRALNITRINGTGQITNGTITILSGGSGTNITNLVINNTNQNGIIINGANNNTITYNNITTTGPAGNIDWSDSGNGGIFTTVGVCINEGSNNNTIANNNITTTYNTYSGDYDSLAGVQIRKNSHGNTINNNTINTTGHNYAYSLTVEGGSTNNTLSNNNITTTGNNTYAIQISSSANNNIIGNQIDNNADNFAYGVLIEASNNATITDNTITDCNTSGIQLENSNNATITGNTLTNNTIGICLDASSGNTITYNSMSNSSTYDLQIQAGSTGNHVYYNNFYSDLARDDGSNNTWDNGVDTGNYYEGGGTSARPITGSAGSVDHYPSDEPFDPP